jgi:glyoxylase-like metal-dependent hydrolase (beta-lactamase superfamily II)
MNELGAPPAKPRGPTSVNGLTHPFPDPPGPAETIEVAPGIHWLRMPLPYALDHINLWLIEDGTADDPAWTIIDSGMLLDQTKELWRALFEGPMAGRKAGRLIVTHFHPDHMGLAGWLVEELGCELWISRIEWLMHAMLYFDDEAVLHESQIRVYRENGLGADWIEAMTGRGNSYRKVVGQAPMNYVRIADGDEIEIGGRIWRVIVGTGHAPEHACLYCPDAGVLISGDQILPKITPNVSLWAGDREADPLGDYLDSLGKFRDLPAETLVLPSHNLPFTGIGARLDQLAHHHDGRLDDIVAACASPKSAADILSVLFRREMDVHHIGFAMGESLAHLAHLRHLGRIEKVRRDDGVIAYRRLPG